jgi:Zn-finger nucleic acid-binding protein
MSKLGECLSNFVLGLKFILSIVNCVLKVSGIVLMPTGYKRAISDGSNEWQISRLPIHKSEGEKLMDCPRCNVRMQEFEPSSIRTILFCPRCGARIIITLTQGNSTTLFTLDARQFATRDWGEFDRVPVPLGIQHSFSDGEVLEP